MSKIVKISSDYSKLVLQDKANILINVNADGKDKQEVQAKLKKQSEEVLKTIGLYKEVKSHVKGQTINKDYKQDKDKVIENCYTGTIVIELISYDFEQLNKALDDIEPQTIISSIETGISSKIRKEQEIEITKEAIKQYQMKSQLVTESFGFKKYSIDSVEVSNCHDESAHAFDQCFTGGAMASSFSSNENNSPFIAPKQEKLTVKVTGQIILELSGIID